MRRNVWRRSGLAAALAVCVTSGLAAAAWLAPAPADAAAPTELAKRARAVFGMLPEQADSETNPITEAKITLGRMLFYENRISKSQQISCNSCHVLDRFGVDGEPTSPGHRGQRGDRNSPTVYNAAFHIAQFWDGRASDVEEQAKGPVLNPVEMAMPDEAHVLRVLKSIPGYEPLFRAAFPGDEDPISYDGFARAVGAFERRLVTPSRFDAFLGGDVGALTLAEQAGLATFLEVGCSACHAGPTLGGTMHQKLGLVNPYPTEDVERARITGKQADRFFFKVPSLRNVAKTGPYFHDGKVRTLEEAVRRMAHHQLGRELTKEQIGSIVTFLGSLTGELPASYIAAPKLPPSCPETPKPDLG